MDLTLSEKLDNFGACHQKGDKFGACHQKGISLVPVTKTTVKNLLTPKKIAIIGASEREGFGGDTCRNVIEYMNKDDYFFINMKGGEAFGIKCYTSLKELPEKVELIVICTPQKTVNPLLTEAAELGIKAAVVYASGYSEVGTDEGRVAEAELVELCEKLGMALMGPNCAGYINFAKGISPFAFISDKRDRKGSVGVISQSGQLALSMMDSPKMKFSYAISAGNCSVCKMEDYLDFLVDDEDTKVVAVYIEGITQPEKFIQVLKKAAIKKKPIVVLKTGRSAKGQAIAASHTGSMSGSDKVYDALFEKFGVIRVEDLEELMATALVLATLKKLPKDSNFASMNLSGGETAICADLAELNGIVFKDFAPETLAKLKEMLPSYATPNNPLDMTASLSYDVEKYAAALKTVMDDPSASLVAVGYTLLEVIADPAIRYMAKSIEQVCSDPMAKPVVMIPFAENTRNVEYSEILEKSGVPVLPSAQYAFKILKNIGDFVSYDPDKCDLNVIPPKSSICSDIREIPDIRETLDIHEPGKVFTESESKDIIAKYGIPFPKCIVAKSEEEAVEAIKIVGLPIVAKIDSPDILHKSDVGCVKIKLDTEASVRSAYNEIIKNAKDNCPNAKIDGVQINSMAKPGTELIIGVNNDPQFGPCILCGLGGVFVEVFKDTSLKIAPVSKYEALEMVLSLKGSKLLIGYRGEKVLDIEAFADAIVSISNFACDNRDSLKEMDLNPIFLYEDGLCAVDALIVNK